MSVAKAGPRMAKERILVVDDEQNARVALRTILSEEGYEIAEAADGEEALALLPGFAPAAVLADVRMPRMDGITLLKRARERDRFHNIVGDAPELQAVYEVVKRAAPTRATVLILGESGTGKELIAQALHEESPRADKPFIKVNCAALSETLLESELFGHEKGAFTGAIGRKEGRFELADGGTLFLDEIGDITPALQIKLLR